MCVCVCFLTRFKILDCCSTLIKSCKIVNYWNFGIVGLIIYVEGIMLIKEYKNNYEKEQKTKGRIWVLSFGLVVYFACDTD